ncbi:MAG: hypothetical protein CMJ79_15705 [Planctomycetaceae bacterium]|nr:hypothetical protein [Planctomycetaceae bacterium]
MVNLNLPAVKSSPWTAFWTWKTSHTRRVLTIGFQLAVAIGFVSGMTLSIDGNLLKSMRIESNKCE